MCGVLFFFVVVMTIRFIRELNVQFFRSRSLGTNPIALYAQRTSLIIEKPQTSSTPVTYYHSSSRLESLIITEHCFPTFSPLMSLFPGLFILSTTGNNGSDVIANYFGVRKPDLNARKRGTMLRAIEWTFSSAWKLCAGGDPPTTVSSTITVLLPSSGCHLGAMYPTGQHLKYHQWHRYHRLKNTRTESCNYG